MSLISNREAYLGSRSMVGLKIRANPPLESDYSSPLSAVFLQGYVVKMFDVRLSARKSWVSRDGTGVVDKLGHRAVAARNLALIPALPFPGWQQIVDAIDKHQAIPSEVEYRVAPFVAKWSEPVHFGPGFYYLWAEAAKKGRDMQDCFRCIVDWTWHRPGCWDRDVEHYEGPMPAMMGEKFRRLWYDTHPTVWIDPALAPYFEQTVAWLNSGDLNSPWLAEVAGDNWAMRINDFPEEYMYSLLVNGQSIGDFLEWPETWRRGRDVRKSADR